MEGDKLFRLIFEEIISMAMYMACKDTYTINLTHDRQGYCI
jgi:hypothetical protein